MKQIPADEFKMHRLAVMDDVNTGAEPVVITK